MPEHLEEDPCELHSPLGGSPVGKSPKPDKDHDQIDDNELFDDAIGMFGEILMPAAIVGKNQFDRPYFKRLFPSV